MFVTSKKKKKKKVKGGKDQMSWSKYKITNWVLCSNIDFSPFEPILSFYFFIRTLLLPHTCIIDKGLKCLLQTAEIS